MSSAIRSYARELKRPWKLLCFALGTGLMIGGAFYFRICDWDVGVSLVMCTLTWLTAPWALHVVLQRQWRWLPLALLCCWVSVDGAYWLYHTLVGNEMLRRENALTSTPLYWLMGAVWLYRGSLADLRGELMQLAGRRGR